jgi:hypothetical protein
VTGAYYLDKHEVENEILLRRIKGRHPNVLRSYLRRWKEATRELARQVGYWPQRVRTIGKMKCEWEEMRNLARGMDETTRQTQTDKISKRIMEK